MALIDLTGPDKFIDDLSNTDPEETDDGNQLGFWSRGIQNVLINNFPNLTAAVTPTAAELNHMVGQDQGVGTGDSVAFAALDSTPIGVVTPAAGEFTTLDADTLDYNKQTWRRVSSADSPVTAAVGDNIFCTCDGAITINLPATPDNGDRVLICVDSQCDSTNSVTIDPDGANTVMGESTVEIDLAFAPVLLVANTTDDWDLAN
jgi:hypothetical protein